MGSHEREGPQYVTVHGRDEVVVICAEKFRRLKGSVTGQALIDPMQASPFRDVDFEPKRGTMPIRDVILMTVAQREGHAVDPRDPDQCQIRVFEGRRGGWNPKQFSNFRPPDLAPSRG